MPAERRINLPDRRFGDWSDVDRCIANAYLTHERRMKERRDAESTGSAYAEALAIQEEQSRSAAERAV